MHQVVAGTDYSQTGEEPDNDISQQSIEKSIEDAFSQAHIYDKSNPFTIAFGRVWSLLITFLIELIPAFILGEGSDKLDKLLPQNQSKVFVGFIAVVSAISGNVGLQSSAILTRAISHRLVSSRDWKRAYVKEVVVALMLAGFIAAITGGVAGLWAKSLRVGICIGLAQAISIMFAGLSGAASPMVFHMLLGRDPGMWAGPLETAVQDIAGALSLFFLSPALLQLMPAHW